MSGEFYPPFEFLKTLKRIVFEGPKKPVKAKSFFRFMAIFQGLKTFFKNFLEMFWAWVLPGRQSLQNRATALFFCKQTTVNAPQPDF